MPRSPTSTTSRATTTISGRYETCKTHGVDYADLMGDAFPGQRRRQTDTQASTCPEALRTAEISAPGQPMRKTHRPRPETAGHTA